jgi:hypothetical protein
MAKATPAFRRRVALYRATRRKRGFCQDCPKKVWSKGRIHCLTCRNKRRRYGERNPWVHRNSLRKQRYGVSTDRYIDMLFEQFGKCAVCSKYFTKKPCVDHDHFTNKTRGLVCSRCNNALWSFEDVSLVKRARAYLLFYKRGDGELQNSGVVDIAARRRLSK